MDVKTALGILEKDKEFNAWVKKHKDFYFANAFVMLQGTEKIDSVQLGYCNKKGDKITSFIVDEKEVKMFTDEVFKRPESKVCAVKVEDVVVDIGDVLKKANGFREKKYPADVANKKVFILQNSDNGVIWNISFITDSLNVLNFKIACKDGKLLKHNKTSLLQFRSN
tara:strand:- start:108 stop:608 length:501 start_codon:yes stop_codon:yes gene_type:complete